jgi:hypothetical protein
MVPFLEHAHQRDPSLVTNASINNMARKAKPLRDTFLSSVPNGERAKGTKTSLAIQRTVGGAFWIGSLIQMGDSIYVNVPCQVANNVITPMLPANDPQLQVLELI